jgi:hypothetical protein
MVCRGWDRQTLLFSATMPAALVQFTRAGLKSPEMIRLDVDTKISENLKVNTVDQSNVVGVCDYGSAPCSWLSWSCDKRRSWQF